MLRDSIGSERLLWGSDWPHTQFESAENFKKTRAFLHTMVPDAGEREAILSKNPATLFRFS
jgi:predicted TIM-barrel fold metal-dependent hydrolase